MDNFQIFRATQFSFYRAKKHYKITRIFKPGCSSIIELIHYTNHSNYRGREDAGIFSLIIKTYIATSNRSVQFTTGIADPQNCMLELIIYFRIIGIAKVEAVR